MEQHLAVLGSHKFYYPTKRDSRGRQNKGDSHARGGKRIVVDKNTLMLLFFILDVITLNVTNNKYINTLSK